MFGDLFAHHLLPFTEDRALGDSGRPAPNFGEITGGSTQLLRISRVRTGPRPSPTVALRRGPARGNGNPDQLLLLFIWAICWVM